MPQDDSIPTGLCQCGCGQTTNVIRGVPNRFVTGHNRSATAGDSRSGRRVDWPNYTVEDRGYETPCHTWQGSTNGLGYGRVGNGRHSAKVLVHAAVYEREHGPTPDGHDVHHKCRIRNCINPDHLEAITKADHIDIHHLGAKRVLRETCRRGHAFTPENTYLGSNGYRYCRACRTEYKRGRATGHG